MLNILTIGIGGFLGSCARYLLSSQIYKSANTMFPIGTFAVNMIGSFCIGFFYESFNNITVPSEYKNFVTVGFLGGFTTFSSFALENINLLRDGELKYFLLNVIFSNIIGLVGVVAGIYSARIIFKVIK
jgi:fluoride exporter